MQLYIRGIFILPLLGFGSVWLYGCLPRWAGSSGRPQQPHGSARQIEGPGSPPGHACPPSSRRHGPGKPAAGRRRGTDRPWPAPCPRAAPQITTACALCPRAGPSAPAASPAPPSGLVPRIKASPPQQPRGPPQRPATAPHGLAPSSVPVSPPRASTGPAEPPAAPPRCPLPVPVPMILPTASAAALGAAAKATGPQGQSADHRHRTRLPRSRTDHPIAPATVPARHPPSAAAKQPPTPYPSTGKASP